MKVFQKREIKLSQWRVECYDCQMEYSLARVVDDADWQTYHRIRHSVLWEERGRSDYDETRPEERLPHHHPLLFRLDGRGAGTTRLDDLRDGTGIVRLVAIASALRRQGHGGVMNAMIEEYADRLGIHTLFVNAANDAVGFYASTGWSRFEGGRLHELERSAKSVSMRKLLLR